MKPKTFQIHYVFTAALALAADVVFGLPFIHADAYNAVSLVAAVAVTAAVLFLLNLCLNTQKPRIGGLFNKRVPKIFGKILFFLLAAFSGAKTYFYWVEYFSKLILPKNAVWAIAVVAFFCAAYLAFGKNEGLLKIGLFSFVICLIFTVLLLFLSAENFEISTVIPTKPPQTTAFLLQMTDYLKCLLPTALLLAYYQVKSLNACKAKCSVLALLCGAVLMLICLFNVLLIFGTQYAAQMPFAYNEAVSTVSIGILYTRMDGLAYFVYFILGAVKTAVCMMIMRQILPKGILKAALPFKSQNVTPNECPEMRFKI